MSSQNEKTIALIKPDAVQNGHIGSIIRRIETNGFRITSMRMLHFTLEAAQSFYAEHQGKAFFEALTTFTASGPCVALVLERKDAIRTWRELMGPSDSTKARPGTIRYEFGNKREGLTYRNAVHGSDSQEAFEREHMILDGLERSDSC